ncbi:MAG: symmetrical bis(5'-nucleosyl)-tetraphosphatase [Ketobacteraceae bacterium]|nr:symmetrical bis(5'-nucleosyl)-tetraphosphatase [Ketobacteraceae bacterium]
MLYAIGDLQGCLEPFDCLLRQIGFNADRDQLWLAGDLVNRGPDSLKTLRRCYDLRDNITAVQGNHDLHLLATAFDPERDPKRKDTLSGILEAPDRDTLLDWLIQNPLLHVDDARKAVLVHAGIAPVWDLATAQERAAEVETVLRDPHRRMDLFKHMYGNTPDSWDDALEGTTRWRVITNFFTRMRLCDASFHLNLSYKGTLQDAPAGFYPWFATPGRTPIDYRIFFGHWAALMGETSDAAIIGLDHGCVWGNRLSAYCLDTREWFHCDC